MSSIRSLWLVASVLVVALAFGCSGGDAPAERTEEGSAATPPSAEPPGNAEEAGEVVPEGEEEGDVAPGSYPVVEMRTSAGTITLELYPDRAPKTVDNFLSYVRRGFYDGTIFHRVVPGFVIQGGGFTTEMIKKETEPPIENEADNGLRNLRGTICMARTNDPHSATSQFFINTRDNAPLDFRERSLRGWGYAVFGKVIDGMDVIDQIEGVQTTSRDGYQDVPVEPVVIESVRVVS